MTTSGGDHGSEKILSGRVAIITGASRGIGRALALRFAQAGANVVIAAKSEESTEKLPGSIHSVADEVRALGVEALPVRCDVRSEEDIQNMVDKTVKEFGKVDILVNNAGVLWWEPVVKTPPKRYELMWQINLRAPYLCSVACLPHMVKNGWGHIIMCSPPITLMPSPGYVTYMTTKMGATRLAIGIAAEHRRDNVAANSLWPATPIESQATINWGSDKMGGKETWRSPDILCDAAMEILKTEPKQLTGKMLIDEELLKERGWTQEKIDTYWTMGTPPKNPLWIDGRTASAMMAKKEQA
jgi:citronellol/citronellal dehydrogenase